MENVKNKAILISVIVPTYNRAKVIHRAINSVRNQAFGGWECIIVDDGSTDNSLEVIQKLIENDDRFCLITNERKKGAPGARNTGILKAQGEYVVLFDSDNVMHPEFLEKEYNKITREKVDICGCFSTIIDEKTGSAIGKFCWEGYGHIHSDILRGKSYFDNSSTMIKREKLLGIGLLDEDCPSFQEWDTHIRLSGISTYSTIKEELVDYYRGGSDTISKSQKRSILGQLYILKKFKGDMLKNVPLSYIRHCLYNYAKIKNLSVGEDRDYLQQQFEKNMNMPFMVLIKMIYPLKVVVKYLKK